MFGRFEQIKHQDYETFLRFQEKLSTANLNPIFQECLLEMFSSGFLYVVEAYKILEFFVEHKQVLEDFDSDFPQADPKLNSKAQFMNYLNTKKFPVRTLREIIHRNKVHI